MARDAHQPALVDAAGCSTFEPVLAETVCYLRGAAALWLRRREGTQLMSIPIVPGYSELEKIGAGGFGAVYRATQTAVGREVALKVLHQATADEDTERRFQRECRVVGSLSWHPHIAAVLDAGADAEGRSYLVFELLSGGSLGDRLKESGPIPWAEAVRFAVQLADALAAAHEQEVLHRDVKPDNILIDRLGRAQLADFGIAQMHDGNQTKSGVITATLAHAAPEVLSGKRATTLSDVYLLGSTLFELITGEPPFGKTLGNDFFGAIQRIVTEPAPRLDAVDAISVPVGLADIVERTLCKDPSDRYGSAAELGLALRLLQQQESSAVTAMPFVESTGGHSDTAVEPPADPAATPPPAEPPLASPESASPAHLPLAKPPSAAPHVDDLSASTANIAASPTGPSNSTPSIQSIDVQTVHLPSTPKSRLPLVVAAVVVAALVIGAAFLLTRDQETASTEITVFEALETGSQAGQVGANAVDGDLVTGWLTPNGPDGHQIVVGFGERVSLDSIRVHTGPDAGGSDVLANSRGLGPIVLEFSDGTSRELELDPSVSIRSIEINKETTSLAIRTLSQGAQPVAIREIEFVGESVS